jgi:hypothetical protein
LFAGREAAKTQLCPLHLAVTHPYPRGGGATAGLEVGAPTTSRRGRRRVHDSVEEVAGDRCSSSGSQVDMEAPRESSSLGWRRKGGDRRTEARAQGGGRWRTAWEVEAGGWRRDRRWLEEWSSTDDGWR